MARVILRSPLEDTPPTVMDRLHALPNVKILPGSPPGVVLLDIPDETLPALHRTVPSWHIRLSLLTLSSG